MREYHGFSCKSIEIHHQRTQLTIFPQGGNVLPFGTEIKTIYAGLAFATIGGACLYPYFTRSLSREDDKPSILRSFWLFFYSCFIKPHQGDAKGNQQDALESFYKKQAGVYDATRNVLLRGREDMLSLVAAQLEVKTPMSTANGKVRRVWVDVSHVPSGHVCTAI
jgi:betaine lipid synthase